MRGELLHYLRDHGYGLRTCHRLLELWMRACRPVALGLGDPEFAALLKISLVR